MAPADGSTNHQLMGKAVAMNARNKGSLTTLVLGDWFVTYTQL
jgi:hypothetical protein